MLALIVLVYRQYGPSPVVAVDSWLMSFRKMSSFSLIQKSYIFFRSGKLIDIRHFEKSRLLLI